MAKKATLNSTNLLWLVKTYGNDPVGFAKDICGFKKLDPWQIWFLEATLTRGQGAKKIAIASCHSSGKTLISSVIALHRLICYPESRLLITSATKDQLKSAFGGTLGSVIEKSIISEWFDLQAETVTLLGVAESWIKLQAWSINRPESFAGIHPQSPCLIADEASAIDHRIFESWSGNMMHPNSLEILLGNPLYRRGELFDAFHSKKEFYETATVSAKDSSFIDKNWIKEMASIYGEDSDIYRVRVLGQFPESDIDSFISDKKVKLAVNREVIDQPFEPVLGGLDVGKFKDASVLTIRKGHKILAIINIRTRDLMVVAEEVGKHVIDYNIQTLCVDANGIGSGVADRLRQIHGDKVFDVFLGNLPNTEKEFFNNRVKLWGKMKSWLEYGSIPNNQDLINELPSLLYSYDVHGRFVLEKKSEAVKRGIGSPDYADSLAYTFAVSPQLNEVKPTNYNNNVSFNWY